MKTLRKILTGAMLASSLSGCGNNQNLDVWTCRYFGNFLCHPVAIAIEETGGKTYGQGEITGRQIVISEKGGFKQRGYVPAHLVANDKDLAYGFEEIQIFPERDWKVGVEDSSKVKSLERFNDPYKLEDIFAQFNADIKGRVSKGRIFMDDSDLKKVEKHIQKYRE